MAEHVVLEITVDGEIEFNDGYPWDGEWWERALYDDGLHEFADRLVEALMPVTGVMAASVGWTSRTEGGRVFTGGEVADG